MSRYSKSGRKGSFRVVRNLGSISLLCECVKLPRSDHLRGVWDPSGCIAQVDAILADSPNFADAYLVRAAAFVRTREFDAALSDVNSFITMRGVGNAPRRESPFLLKAVILFHRSSFTESIAALRIALELHPDSIPATELLWKCYVKVKDPSLAHIAAARLYQIAPSTDSSNRAMGTSLFALKRFGAAVPYLQKCLQDNNSSELRLLLAGAYFGELRSSNRGIRRNS